MAGQNMFLLLVLLLGAPHVSVQQQQGPGFAYVRQTPSEFGLTRSEGISSLGSWALNPALGFTCVGPDGEPYVVGPANPELCVERIEVTMSSKLFGNVTVVFDADQLSELRSVDPTDPTQYAWGLPLNKYAVPNAYYEGGIMNVTFPEGWVDTGIDGNVRNYFNASATSLREYYGVYPSLQGSEETVQGSIMYFGFADTAVNETAANEYLELQGLVPNVPLQIHDWAPQNDFSVCEVSIHCGEPQLDVEAQQAFAPQAVTFFGPTEAALVAHVAEEARSEGYTEDEIQQIIEDFEAYVVSPDRIQENSDSALPPRVNPSVIKATQDYFRDFVSNMTSSEERVQVISLSWGHDYSVGTGDFRVYEEGLKNMTLSGITILVASGDSGASGTGGGQGGCLLDSNPLLGNQTSLIAPWPQASPWVTTVGGTQFLATADDPQAEVVCSSATGGGITSGGGFAGPALSQDLFSMPAWQKTTVERYLAENNQSTFAAFPTAATPGWNPTGRAFPDIASYSARFPIVGLSGEMRTTAGTSLSTPMASALFSLANQALMRDGYDVIGYANPMLYWMGENCMDAFNDITMGNNQGGRKQGDECLFGFPAAPGWDAATGLGSINFGPFVECAKRYQDEVRNKGLEILPDGSYRGSPTDGPSPTPPLDSGKVAMTASVVMLALSLSLLAV